MDLFLETPQQQAERMLRPAATTHGDANARGGSPALCAKCRARCCTCSCARVRIGTRGLFRTARFICAGARVRQASCASSPRGPAPAHIGDDRAHSARTCGDFLGLVCVHLHPQRCFARRSAPTSVSPRPAPRRCHNNNPRRLGELASLKGRLRFKGLQSQTGSFPLGGLVVSLYSIIEDE